MIALVAFDDGDAAAILEPVLRRAGYAGATEPDTGAGLRFELGDFGGRRALRVWDAPRRLLVAIARGLRAEVVEISTLGREDGAAWGCAARDGDVVDIDADAVFQELLAEWIAESDDGRLYLDDAPNAVLDELAAELFGADPGTELEVDRTLVFEPTVPARLTPVLAAIADGAAHEWTELGGQPAIRVTMSATDSMIEVVDAREAAALEAAIASLAV